jgi:hypothetical protein
MVKLNKKQTDLFFKEFEYWQRRIGLEHINVYKSIEETKGCYAMILYNTSGIATLKLNPNFETYCIDNIEESLKRTAKHEAMHLLLGDFSTHANCRYSTASEIEDAEEHVVLRLMKLIN